MRPESKTTMMAIASIVVGIAFVVFVIGISVVFATSPDLSGGVG